MNRLGSLERVISVIRYTTQLCEWNQISNMQERTCLTGSQARNMELHVSDLCMFYREGTQCMASFVFFYSFGCALNRVRDKKQLQLRLLRLWLSITPGHAMNWVV